MAARACRDERLLGMSDDVLILWGLRRRTLRDARFNALLRVTDGTEPLAALHCGGLSQRRTNAYERVGSLVGLAVGIRNHGRRLVVDGGIAVPLMPTVT